MSHSSTPAVRDVAADPAATPGIADADVKDLIDAAVVHAAREAIVQVLGPLAASPLDEQVTHRMRLALDRASSPAVRRAIRRLSRPKETRPPLVAVPLSDDGEESGRTQDPTQAFSAPQVMATTYAGGGAA